MNVERKRSILRSLTIHISYVVVALAGVTATLTPPFVQAAEQTIDLDGKEINGAESRVVTKVLQSFPVQIENTIFSNATGEFLFNWPGAGPGGFASFLAPGPGVGTKWVWTSVSQVFTIESPVTFTAARTLPVIGGTSTGGVVIPGQGDVEGNVAAFVVPGKSIDPTEVTLSSLSLVSSLITFFSPDKTVASCGVECVSGECSVFLQNLSPGTATMKAEQSDCCLEPQQTICDGECKSYLTDTSNCGGCGIQCGPEEFCSEGVCACPAGQTQCGTGCFDLPNDTSNCGSCDNQCGPEEFCSGGVCACPAGQTQCGTGCLDLQSDSSNCGGCGNQCGAEQFCSQGACACTTEGLSICGGICLDLQNDDNNCGACGNVCELGEICVDGGCACPVGQTQCGTGCVDLQVDTSNCGVCGNPCGADQFCSQGACGCTNAGLSICGGTCLDLQNDDNNCGACGNVCELGEICVDGGCACPVGQTQCGTGCVDLSSDTLNCGACGDVCGANDICTTGTCKTCRPPQQTACNNTCVNVHTDPFNCGGCGNVCDFTDCPSSGTGTCSQGSSCICDPDPNATTSTLRFDPAHTDAPTKTEIDRSSKAVAATRAAPATTSSKVETRLRSESTLTPKAEIRASMSTTVETRSLSESPLGPDTEVGPPMPATGVSSVSEPSLALTVEEALVCDIPPIEQIIPSGGTHIEPQPSARVSKQIETTATITVNGEIVASGPCPLIVANPDVDTSGVILSPVSVATMDSSGDGLCQPTEDRCDYLIRVVDLGDTPCVNPFATLSSPPDQFNPNEITVLNATSPYPNWPAFPGIGVPLEEKTNDVAFSITTQADQAPDIGRVYLMSVNCMNLPEPVVMPIVLGIGSVCDPQTDIDGETYDHVDGFQAPIKAALVPQGNPINFSTANINHGSTIPFKLSLACGSQVLSSEDINQSPEIVVLDHETLGPQSLVGINGENNANPDDPFFSCGATGCDYQFRTEGLPIGTFVISIRMPDTRIFRAGYTVNP